MTSYTVTDKITGYYSYTNSSLEKYKAAEDNKPERFMKFQQ